MTKEWSYNKFLQIVYMSYSIFAISVIIGVFVLGVAGFYQYSAAEIQIDFICDPNVKNGHVMCSVPPKMGDHGLFVLDSENSCPIDVTFIIENRMAVEIQDSPDCKFNDGFMLALTMDR